MSDLFDLSGQTVLVTGGTSYLGTAMCHALAEYGANVVIASRNLDKCTSLAETLTQTYSGKHSAILLDVLDGQSVTAGVERAIQQYGRIDALINNANVSSPGFVESFTEEQWEKGIDGTINAVFRCTRAILPYMLEEGKGTILNIASMYGVVSPNPEIYGTSGQNNPANYGAGKAAIIQFTRYLACHYGRKGIRANAISPGPFPNEQTQQNKEFIAQLSNKTALGRIGLPDELKGAVLLLVSSAGSYITGQNLAVDGGWTAW
ncbi:SDR family oxidoreductase [Paenibacillus timonensis]|uniref:SDR family oxidoreductase n=1 Tax=Paenibacillus timonensis TaxID=225915 RepID=UPI0022E91B32|nr:SDR family oxidoreductase [Paenibacillus timonensis]